jgi:hypothetical protein
MKTVYLAWIFHGNMSYDRYTKHTIRKQFPAAYQVMIDDFVHHPELKGHVELSGLSVESLRLWAPGTIDQLKELAAKGQITFCASYFAAPVNACMDGNSHLAALELGTRIVADACGPVDGLFCQEQSYTPQLPWAMNQLGIKWVSVPAGPAGTQPHILRGFDGSKVYGIPIAHMPWRNFAEVMREAAADSLFLFVGDYEMYNPISRVLELAKQLEPEGIRIEITLVSEYLRRFPPQHEEYLGTCRFPEPVEAPHFSRWCSDPEDIRLHHTTMQAMNDLRDARILSALVRRRWGQAVDAAAAAYTPTPDLRTVDIEWSDEFTAAQQYCASGADKQLKALDKASFLISWGCNSDARGWYPLKERRFEHDNALRHSSLLSKSCIIDALSFIGSRVRLADKGIPILLYNGTVARSVWCRFSCDRPYRVVDSLGRDLPSETVLERDGFVVAARVELPAYGYTLVYLVQDSATAAAPTSLSGASWVSGLLSVTQGANTLAWQGQSLEVQAGGHTYSVRYDLPAVIRELTQSQGLVTRQLPAPGAAHVFGRPGLCPELLIHHELDFGMHLQQRYTLEDELLRCRWSFDCSRPYLLGEKDYFQPRGLAAVITGSPGTAFYDAGYSVLAHGNPNAGYLVALQMAGVQSTGGGITVVSTSGAQSFWFDPQTGELRLGLGATTVGGPAMNPDTMTVDTAARRITHFNTWDEELFFGTYEHEFVICPFTGTWQEQGVAVNSLAINTPVRQLRLTGGSHAGEEAPSASLLEVTSPSVCVQSATWEDGKLKLLLNEIAGKEAACRLRVGDDTITVTLQGGELRYVSI